MISEIIYNGKSSYKDLGLRISSREIGYPAKKKITIEVPHMNGSYDFSSLYGKEIFSDRELTFKFDIIPALGKRYNMHQKKDELINWIYSTNSRSALIDSECPDYYYIAEVVDKPEFEDHGFYGTATIKFVANPYRVSVYNDSHDIWDLFNFEKDMTQKLSYNGYVDGTLELTNTGSRAVNLYIKNIGKISTSIYIVKTTGVKSVTVTPGQTNSGLSIEPGKNSIRVKNASRFPPSSKPNPTEVMQIEFSWNKEII